MHGDRFIGLPSHSRGSIVNVADCKVSNRYDCGSEMVLQPAGPERPRHTIAIGHPVGTVRYQLLDLYLIIKCCPLSVKGARNIKQNSSVKHYFLQRS